MTMRRSTGLLHRLNGIHTNLITNGGFDSATTGWTSAAASLSSDAGGQAGNCLTITNSGAASGSCYQDIATRVGKIYLLTLYIKKGTGAGCVVKVGTTGTPDAILTSPSYTDAAWAQKKLAFVATATTTRITLVNNDAGAGNTALFDTVVASLVSNGVGEIFEGCFIDFYSGLQPSSADTGVPSTQKIITFTNNGDGTTGLTWADAVWDSTNLLSKIVKNTAETWKGVSTNSSAVTAGFFRVYEAGDDPSITSTTAARFDGAIGTSGAEFNATNTTIDANSTQTIGDFAYKSLPY